MFNATPREQAVWIDEALRHAADEIYEYAVAAS